MSDSVSRRVFLGGTAGAVAGCRARKAAPFPGYAFVANYDANTVAVVDLATFSVTRQIRLDDSPSALALHPSKALVYVLTPQSGAVHEIDAQKLAVTRRVRIGGPAMMMIVSPAEQSPALWVLGMDRKLLRIDADQMRLAGQIALPDAASSMDVARYHNRAAVAYGESGSAGLIDLATGKAGRPIRISDRTGAVRFRSDGAMLIVADVAGRTLALLQAVDGRLISKLPLAIRPDNLCFSKDSGQLFVTGEGRDVVAVIYPFYVPEVAETALAGRAPGAMAASKQYLFVANPTAGDVSIFDIRTHKTIAVAAVGAEPGYIAVTPDDQYALVLNQKSGDVAVIKTLGIRNDRSKAAALFTMIPVGSKPVAAVIRAV